MDHEILKCLLFSHKQEYISPAQLPLVSFLMSFWPPFYNIFILNFPISRFVDFIIWVIIDI